MQEAFCVKRCGAPKIPTRPNQGWTISVLSAPDQKSAWLRPCSQGSLGYATEAMTQACSCVSLPFVSMEPAVIWSSEIRNLQPGHE